MSKQSDECAVHADGTIDCSGYCDLWPRQVGKGPCIRKPGDPGVHLQGCGLHISKPAAEIQVGDVLVWNFGYQEEVTEVIRVSLHFVKVTLRTERGEYGQRRLKLDRRVAWSPKATAAKKQVDVQAGEASGR